MAGVICAICLLLVACGTPPAAPVSARQPPPSERITHHEVSRGETLFSIAWRYELDMKKLAAANGIAPPYTLYPGQRLSLDTSRVAAPARTAKTVTAPKTGTVTKPGLTVPTGTSSRGSDPKNTAKPSPPTAARSPATSRSTRSSPNAVNDTSGWKWQWPVAGRVTRHYDSNRVFKGIYIQSAAGRSVKAAAPGVVVYAGNGLRGYGQLIIIRHNERYLSAYAQNRRMYVGEGDQVKGGQNISEVGGDPANRGRAYFEIRENGKPIDPIRLLPRQ